MRSLLLISLLLALVPTYPKPKMAVSVYPVANGVRVKWVIAASGGPDSTVVDVSGPTAVHRKYLVLNKTDSVDYLAPAPGDSIGGAVTAASWRRFLSSQPTVKPWTYREPDQPPPPPGVTVQVLPISATVRPGQSFQFQASTNSGQPIVWRVVGLGTVTQTGLYTAPL
jgi:hypothetical protein